MTDNDYFTLLIFIGFVSLLSAVSWYVLVRMGNNWFVVGEGQIESIETHHPSLIEPGGIDHALGIDKTPFLIIKFPGDRNCFYNGTQHADLKPGRCVRVYGNMLGLSYCEFLDEPPRT